MQQAVEDRGLSHAYLSQSRGCCHEHIGVRTAQSMHQDLKDFRLGHTHTSQSESECPSHKEVRGRIGKRAQQGLKDLGVRQA